MNCSCDKLNCPCDRLIHPKNLNIPAGLSSLPRQIAEFPEFRNAMLASIHNENHSNQLWDWRARGKDDLGIMLFEMWAYVCDVLAFYDEAIAQEAYLQTARQYPSLRKLVGLLGYLPKPAVSAYVRLALLADGRQSITVPAGTAFRSGAFDGQPPQVFEATKSAIIHPFLNSWSFEPVLEETIGSGSGNTSQFLLKLGSTNIKIDDVVIIKVLNSDDSIRSVTAGKVNSANIVTEQDGNKYMRMELSPSAGIPCDTPPDRIRILKATQTASLWSITGISSNPDCISSNQLILDSQYPQIKPDQYLILQKGDEFRSFSVNSVSEQPMQLSIA
ncbi:MAG: hypothetical protein AAB116_09575, partial [Candidatus Poribacteria bacterium]